MGFIEGLGSALGSVASGAGKGAASLGRVSGEMPSLETASISGLARFDNGPAPVPFGTGQAFGAGPIGSFAFFKEGPVSSLKGFVPMGKSDLKTLDLTGRTNKQSLRSGDLQSFNPVGEILFQAKPGLSEAAGAVAEAESIISQAQKPDIPSFVILNEVKDLSRDGSKNLVPLWGMRVPNELGDSSLVTQNDKLVKLLVTPVKAPNIVEFPKPQIITSPALERQIVTRTQTKTEQQSSAATAPAVKSQPALQEQNKEEVATERVITKQINTVEEEETEATTLKDVVDLPVLNKRIEEFGSAAEIVGSRVKEESLEEIDGERVVELVGSETAEKRSGLVKEKGPDGSRVETIEAVAPKKFSSVKQAKEQIIAIITQKLPVKKAKEGITVGREAVVRVLKYFFVKTNPAEKLIERVVKKKS